MFHYIICYTSLHYLLCSTTLLVMGFINKMITFASDKIPIQPYEDNRNHRPRGN